MKFLLKDFSIFSKIQKESSKCALLTQNMIHCVRRTCVCVCKDQFNQWFVNSDGILPGISRKIGLRQVEQGF